MTQFGAPEIERLPLIEVEQVDRDSAIAAGRSWARWLPEQLRIVEEGRGDYCNLVQAFAHHRLAVLAGITIAV